MNLYITKLCNKNNLRSDILESRSEFYKKTYRNMDTCEYAVPKRINSNRNTSRNNIRNNSRTTKNQPKNNFSRFIFYGLIFFGFIYLTDGKLEFSTMVNEKTRTFLVEDLKIEDRINSILSNFTSNFTEQTITTNGTTIIDESILQEMNTEIEKMNTP